MEIIDDHTMKSPSIRMPRASGSVIMITRQCKVTLSQLMSLLIIYKESVHIKSLVPTTPSLPLSHSLISSHLVDIHQNLTLYLQYSLITLITTFTPPNTVISGPSHPHLHTNGPLTNPIILLFNALITGKRIIFLGYQRPAGQVASVVLAACALGSGCGAILRGFIARAFPYATLTNREEWENV